MENAKCEIWQEHKKCTHFSSRVGWAKEPYFVGRKMLRFLGPEFLPSHKKCLQGKKDALFGWFVFTLADLSFFVCGFGFYS